MSMAMAEAYMARKFHRESVKSIAVNAATTTGGIEENGGGSSRWLFRKLSTKKNSAKAFPWQSQRYTLLPVLSSDNYRI
ncbi:hypothetical protein V5N11_016888 [Cardamine amara subsp. amara]|uniref:Uncharacterized protein n=1 Tax=Cardamine amara subsp. amara TaxID=228776 RepID=A0ABD1BFI1_CARAN